jgi:transposase
MIEYLNGKIYDPKEDVIIEKRPQKEHKQISPEDKFKLLDKEQLITIIKMKNRDKTTQEVSDYIKENFNIYINRNFISKLWLGEELNLSQDILISQEYQDMKLNTKRKNPRKFNKEEIDWILDFNLDKSLGEIAMLFKNKFGKTISKEYISKLSKS